MKNSLPLLAILSVLGCATADRAPAAAAASGNDGAELTAVIDAVKEAIVEGETQEVPGFPPLKSISVKLQTTVSRSSGGGVKYLVVAVGGGASADTTSTLELDMKPPEIRHERTMSPKESLKEALAKAIHLAKIGVAEATKGDPPLTMKSISIDLKFAVQLEGSAAAGVKLVPIGLEGTAKISREKVHSIGLTFGR